MVAPDPLGAGAVGQRTLFVHHAANLDPEPEREAQKTRPDQHFSAFQRAVRRVDAGHQIGRRKLVIAHDGAGAFPGAVGRGGAGHFGGQIGFVVVDPPARLGRVLVGVGRVVVHLRFAERVEAGAVLLPERGRPGGGGSISGGGGGGGGGG